MNLLYSISFYIIIYCTWNLKHLFINGRFNWMIPDLYLGNCCFTKHPFKTGCLGYQVYIHILLGSGVDVLQKVKFGPSSHIQKLQKRNAGTSLQPWEN